MHNKKAMVQSPLECDIKQLHNSNSGKVNKQNKLKPKKQQIIDVRDRSNTKQRVVSVKEPRIQPQQTNESQTT